MHLITDNKRMGWMPSWLPRAFLPFGTTVYNLANDYCADYQGGYWEFAEDDATQARFMFPQSDQPTLHVINPDNYFEGDLTPLEFGMGVCLNALSHLSFRLPSDVSIAVAHSRLYEFISEYGSADLRAFID